MKARQKTTKTLMNKKDNNDKTRERDESPPIAFEEAVKRLLELPPRKQSEIKVKKKDK